MNILEPLSTMEANNIRDLFDNPKFIMHNGIKYIPETEAMQVYKRIYNLIKDQKEYFKTKSPSLKEICEKREWGFIKWYEQNYLKP